MKTFNLSRIFRLIMYYFISNNKTVKILLIIILPEFCVANNKYNAMLYGDGRHDDTEAIQSLLDSKTSHVKLPIPKCKYIISKPLKIYSNQELLLDRYTTIYLADSSNCNMLKSADSLNVNISIRGGIWDCNNKGQLPNPLFIKHSKSPDFDGIGMYFKNLIHFTISDLTIKDT